MGQLHIGCDLRRDRPLCNFELDEYLAMMTKLYAWIAGVVAILAALAGIRHSGAKAERERQEAKRQAEHAESLGRRNDILNRTQDARDETDHLSDAAVADRLRDRWTRPGD